MERRTFLARGALLGAGFIATTVPASAAIGAWMQAGRPRRRTLNGMPLNDPIISAWRDGVGLLKALPASDPFNWANLAAIHGTAKGFNKCPHGNWYFLPWHRAYITMYERKVRELTKFPGFALPYWDWTSQPTLPPAFTVATYNGKPNPLYVGTRTLQGSLPANIVGPAVITKILGEMPYETFGTSRPRGQSSLDEKWITTRTGVQGTLEATPHNQVHNLVGGFMPTTQSPLDPIFMMHHGNLDRLWAVWNAAGHANSDEAFWTDMPFTNNYFNIDGSSWSPKVSELFSPEALGYTYGLARLSTRLRTGQERMGDRMERFFSMTEGSEAPGVNVFRTASEAMAAPGRPLAVPVTVDPARLTGLAAWDGPAAGEELLGLTQDRVEETPIPRVLGVIRNIAFTGERNTEFRVFLNAPANLSASTPVTHPSYVGTFGFFGGMVHEGHSSGKPSVLVDLTDAIGRLHAPGTPLPGRLTVHILPVPLPGRTTAGTAAPEAVEVAIVSM